MNASAFSTALTSLPVSLMFACEGVTISGIELEVHHWDRRAAQQPISKLTRRFTAGDYQVVDAFVVMPSDNPPAMATLQP